MTAPGTVRRVGGGRVEVRFERRFSHSPAKVWRALTDPPSCAAGASPPSSSSITPPARPSGSTRPTSSAPASASPPTPSPAASSPSTGWHAGLELLAAALDARPIDRDVWQRAADLAHLYEESS